MRPRDLLLSSTALLAALACSTPGCTVFDGVVPPAGGAGGAGGTGGTGGTTGDPTAHYLSPEDAASACALVRECARLGESIELSIGIPARQESFSTCMTWLAGPLPASRTGFADQQKLLLAIAKSSTCDAALAQVFVQPLPDPQTCSEECVTEDGVSFAVDCEIGVRVNCGSALFVDGSACLSGANGQPRCSTGECCVGPAGGCSSAEDGFQCDDGQEWLSVCPDKGPAGDTGGLSGLQQELHCAALGITCVDIEVTELTTATERVLPCAPPSEECIGQVGTVCVGAGAIRACIGRVASVVDCAAMSGTCQTGDGAVPACVPDGAECIPGNDGASSCKDDKTLSYCLAGSKAELDCSSLGRACAPPGAGRSAGCQLP